MDRARDRRVLIGRIVDGIVAERDVADDGVEIPVRKRRFLKAFGEYPRIRVELPCDPGGDEVKLNPGAAAARKQVPGHQAEKMPETHRRLKDLRPAFQPKPRERLPHRPYDHGRGEMRVRRRGPCRFIFFIAEQVAHRGSGFRPFGGRVRVKHIRKSAPAGIAHELRLFVLRGRAALGFNLLQGTDGGDVGAGLFFQAPLPDAVFVFYPEVLRRRLRPGFVVFGDEDAGGALFPPFLIFFLTSDF